MSFASVMAQLKLNISNFSTNMKKASDQMAKFAASSTSTGTRASKTFTDYGKRISEATNLLGKHNFGLKDTARIVQGIIISQMFYQAAGAIRDATNALWDFNEQLDYASVTYAGLFGSTDLSDSFLVALREQAEDTIFSFEDLTDMSKKLLAYGIPYKNLMFISEGLVNLGAMSGDSAALDRIALALGQIYAKGKLSAEEMRQLANAYVPIQKIVKEKFGLTEEQMGKIGDLNLPAEDVINAVIDYANENFGAVGDAAMYTITGLKNKIVDSLKNLGVEVIQPISTFYKSFLKFIADKLNELGDIFEQQGIDGLFNYFIPDPAVQQSIRTFFGTVRQLFSSIASIVSGILPLLASFGHSFLNVLNSILPVISTILNITAGIIQTITSNAEALKMLTTALVVCASAWVLFRVQALASLVVSTVAKVLYGVAEAVLFLANALAKNPIVTVLLLISAGIIGISAASNKATGSVNSLKSALSSLSGKSNSSIADQFSERLGDIADSASDTSDAVADIGDSAKKATNGLLSFDEVFKLNETSDSGASDALDLEGILDGLDSLAGGIGDALIPDIPDFSDYITDFVSAFKDSLLAKFALAGAGALMAKKILDWIKVPDNVADWNTKAIGIVNALGKALLGAAVGYAFDAVASLITDKLWAALENAMKLKEGSADQASFGATLGSIIGGAIGMLVGGLPGSLIGAAIGHLAGGIVGLAWQEITDSFASKFAGISTTLEGAFIGIGRAISKAFGSSLTDIAKNLINTGSFSGFFKSIGQIFSATGLKELAKGGLIGAAIGLLTDAIASLLWKGLKESFDLSENSTESAATGQTIGGILGTVIGGILAGPPGAIIGGAIGTFAGGFVGLFWEKIEEAFKPVTDWVDGLATDISNSLSSWWDMTSAGFSDWWSNTSTLFGNWWNYTQSGFSTWWSDTWSGFSTWWEDTKLGVRDWWKYTTNLFSDWDSITSDTLGEWWDVTSSGFSDWWNNTTSGFDEWWNNTTSGFDEWKNTTIATVVLWVTDTLAHLKDWRDKSIKPIKEWAVKTLVEISFWVLDTKEKISTWIADTIKSIGTWALDTYNDVATWVSNVSKAFEDFKTRALKVIGGFFVAAVLAFTEWCNNIWTDVKKWFNDLLIGVQTWWAGLWNPSKWRSGWELVKDWFSSLFNGISNWFMSIGNSINTWWNGLWSNKSANVNLTSSGASIRGYATGGIVNRDQIVRVAEGNKAEAIVPLQDANAMRPFVDAISTGIIEGLAPTLVTSGSSGGLPPMYVGTLIADDRGLKQLYKKFELIQIQENARKGFAK